MVTVKRVGHSVTSPRTPSGIRTEASAGPQQEEARMARKTLGTAIVGLLAIAASPGISAEGGKGFTCSEATLRGTYGVQMHGTRPAPPTGEVETLIGVVLRTYDGRGHFDQVDNIKGSATGISPDRPGFGTYEVNPDCSGRTLFEPGPGIVIEERIVIVERGNQVFSMTSTPPPIMVTTIQKRVDRR
jgi:hypothetical protein